FEFLARGVGAGASEHDQKLDRRPERGAAMPAKRVVAITGAAGGIGGATARVFRDAGWCVVGVDRRDLNGHSDAVDQFIRADIAQTDAPHAIFESILSKHGRLDALVKNAACKIWKPLLATTTDEWDTVQSLTVKTDF